MWTKADLHQLIKDKLGDYLFVVVSNRQPYAHVFNRGRMEVQRGAGGVITALDPVMRATTGSWVAFGNGDADRRISDKQGKLKVPPEDPSYTLKRVWLTKEEEHGYYFGYSNEALWPLFHLAYERPVFRPDDWGHYKKVNEKFANAVIEEVGKQKAFVWIQDYHLCLLPKLLAQALPGQVILSHFWHIPWPSYDTFRICPQRKEILEGLLANDLMGFHVRNHCNNFLEAVDREVESKIDREDFSVVHSDHETRIRPYPISVDFEGVNALSSSAEVTKAREALAEEFKLNGMKVLLGLDRIDYTKGIPERLMAVDELLHRHPELREKIVFVQIGELSRIHIPKYKSLNDQIDNLAEEINWRHSTYDWKPIIVVRRHLSFKELLGFYGLGHVCVISSLHDGMNLVAKEFVSSRPDEGGMLVLSRFAGAAQELTDAVLVNPYDIDQFSEGMFAALNLPEDERRKRMIKMRGVVQNNNIFRWAGKILSELFKFEFKE